MFRDKVERERDTRTLAQLAAHVTFLDATADIMQRIAVTSMLASTVTPQVVCDHCVTTSQVFLQDYPKWARTVEQINAAGAMNHGVWKYYKVNMHPARRVTHN